MLGFPVKPVLPVAMDALLDNHRVVYTPEGVALPLIPASALPRALAWLVDLIIRLVLLALLADRNGIIDVDLPISGSLNDPEFRLGAVILKVIGNLIMKAITAPFSLLAGAFSDAGEQGAVLFALGSAELDEKARQQLDKIANELNNRPALKVTVVG